MKIRNYLDFIDEKLFVILRLFVKVPKAYTAGHISAVTNLHPKTCLRCLNTMSDQGVLHRETVGKSNVYSLGNNYLVKKVLIPLVKNELKLFDRTKDLLKERLANHVIALAIYGSYARGEEKEGSDLDLCVITNEITEDLESELDQLVWEFTRDYELTLSTHVLTRQEFKEKQDLDVIKSIKKEGQWFYGNLYDLEG